MIDQLIAQLKHRDPERRRQAIIALGKSRNMTAIRPLAEVFKNDPSPELRELARKAAQYIRAQNSDSAAPAPPPPPPSPPPQPTISPFTTLDDDLPDPLSFRLPQEPPPRTTRSASAGAEPEKPRRSVIRPIGDETPRSKGAAAAGAAAIGAGAMGVGGTVDQFDYPDLEMLGLVNEQGYYRGDGPLYDDDAPTGDAPAPAEEAQPQPEDARKVAIPVRGREYNVPYDDRQRAKGYVDSALTANMSNDNARAMKLLAQALSINPNLINDGFYNSIASQVTGLDGDGAIQMIVDSQQRKSFVKTAESKKKQARVEKQMSRASESTWGSVTFELVIYGIISFAAPVLLALVTFETARSALTPEQLALLAEDGTSSLAALTAPLNIGVLVTSSLIGGILGILSVLIQSGIIHGIARAMGAIGTFPHLLTVLLRFYNRFLPIFYTLVGAFILLSLLTIGSPLPLCGSLILIGFALYMFFRTAGTIGEAYDRGAGFGCVTLLLSGLVLAIINGVIGYFVGTGILNTLAATL